MHLTDAGMQTGASLNADAADAGGSPGCAAEEPLDDCDDGGFDAGRLRVCCQLTGTEQRLHSNSWAGSKTVRQAGQSSLLLPSVHQLAFSCSGLLL